MTHPPWFVRPLVWTALGCAHLARALGRLTRRVIAPADLCPTCRETLPCLTCGAGL